MRNIGFDAKRITHNGTGLGNYGRFIVRTLADFYPENTYHLYTPSPGKERLRRQLDGLSSVRFHYPARWTDRLCKAAWRSRGVVDSLKRDDISLFHGLSNELPFGLRKEGIRSVVTIHDLIFLRYPHFYKPVDRWIYTKKFRYACLQADKIIAISEMTKRDIIRFFGIPEEKIAVVYQGCDAAFSRSAGREEKERVRAAYGLPERYLLSVGSIESRKNLLLVVEAMKFLPEEIVLVAVGRRTPYAAEVERYARENGLAERVRLLSGVPFADLPPLYQMADLFVYPSCFEGFGIPIVEALCSCVPVIAATGSCLEEAGGPGSLYVDPHDERALAEKINLVWSSPETAERMRKEGVEYVKRFADEAIARALKQVYEGLF